MNSDLAKEIMDWVGSGLVTLAGLMTVGVVSGLVQRRRLARTGGPLADLLRQLDEPPPDVVESLLAENIMINPDYRSVVRRSGKHVEAAALETLLTEVDRILWVHVWVMVGVWPPAVVCLAVGWFSWLWALVLAVPMFMVGGTVVFMITKAMAGLRRQQGSR